MSEENTVTKHKKNFLSDALKVVKGESANQLIEQFTAEMTLVAEGLCEDQSLLRRKVEELQTELDRSRQSLVSSLEAAEQTIHEHQEETDARLKEAEARLAAMEKHQKALETSMAKRKKDKPGWLGQAIILASIVCGTWIVVTILNMIRAAV